MASLYFVLNVYNGGKDYSDISCVWVILGGDAVRYKNYNIFKHIFIRIVCKKGWEYSEME